MNNEKLINSKKNLLELMEFAKEHCRDDEDGDIVDTFCKYYKITKSTFDFMINKKVKFIDLLFILINKELMGGKTINQIKKNIAVSVGKDIMDFIFMDFEENQNDDDYDAVDDCVEFDHKFEIDIVYKKSRLNDKIHEVLQNVIKKPWRDNFMFRFTNFVQIQIPDNILLTNFFDESNNLIAVRNGAPEKYIYGSSANLKLNEDYAQFEIVNPFFLKNITNVIELDKSNKLYNAFDLFFSDEIKLFM